MTLESWLKSLEKLLREEGFKYPQRFIKNNYVSLGYLYTEKIPVESVVADYLEDLISLKKQEYVEKLKAKRQTASHADSSILYNGKMLRRCPKGTYKKGNTCAPGAPQRNPRTRYSKPEGSVSNRQMEKLSKAKSTKDVLNARKYH